VQVKSPAYVGIAYAVKSEAVGVRGLITYIKNVVLKGETDEVAATMPDLALKLKLLDKVYDAYIADLVIAACELQQEFKFKEDGKSKKGKWARACQSKPKYMFNPLMQCCFEEGTIDAAWFRDKLYKVYDSMQNPAKYVGDMVVQQLLP